MIKLNKYYLLRLTSVIFVFSLLLILGINLFSEILLSNNLSLNLGIKNVVFNEKNHHLLHIIKITFIISYISSSLILSMQLINLLFSTVYLKKRKTNSSEKDLNILSLKVGIDSNNNIVSIPEKGLFQNILITGTIGTGKTSSAMYPFTKQLIAYNCNNDKKIGMLILDVKGNYYSEVMKYCNLYNRQSDLIPISLGGFYTYNPLDKPHLKPSVLANQLKNILLLFSPNNSESYWIDKAEEVITEAIKLCRLYNDNYVTFIEIHKLITQESYYKDKVNLLRTKFLSNIFSQEDIYNLLSSLNFFEKEFFALDSRTLNIIKSEISRITNCFVSDYTVQKTFCPCKEELNFYGFKDLINTGKIVVLNMNINEFKNLSKIIAAYLKLDFQTEVMSRLTNNSYSDRIVAFISDEYSEYVTSSDANFFSQSREAKCINIVSTQSYTSLLNTLNNQYSVKVIVQNLVNKLWFRTDDLLTIEDTQKQLGKEEKKKSSHTISENAKQSIYNYLLESFVSKDSNVSESINTYFQNDYIYDTNFFTQQLETFSCIAFLSDGSKIIPPTKIKTFPYFL